MFSKDSIIILGILLTSYNLERSEYMQIKKIDTNKLKVILNANDLKENNIDLNTFMANSLETQELFLDILDLAEEEFNFYVGNSKLIIESISLANNIFIFTITKLNDYKNNNSQNYIYCFDSFENIANIFSFIDKKDFSNIYTYNNMFYFIVNKNNKLNIILNEFSISKIKSTYLENILIEHGKNK